MDIEVDHDAEPAATSQSCATIGESNRPLFGMEFTSPSFQDALADIGTEVIWAPVKMPQFKAIGERFFGTLNTMLFHKLKGGVP